MFELVVLFVWGGQMYFYDTQIDLPSKEICEEVRSQVDADDIENLDLPKDAQDIQVECVPFSHIVDPNDEPNT